MSKGIIYILTNEAMPEICKIGMTSRADLQLRMDELYTTGVPLPFECVFACEVEKADAVERALHTAFEPDRLNPRREFFRIDPYRAIAILKAFGGTDVRQIVEEELASGVSNEEQEATRRYAKKRPKFSFPALGIPEGATICLIEDPEKTATVTSKNTVDFGGEDLNLSALTKQLLGFEYNVAPLPHWSYNGRNLSDIYNDVYPFQ